MAFKFNPFTGTLDEVSAGGGGATPGGSDTEVQFNDGGAFGGDADFTYNKTSNLLTLGGDINLDDGGTFTTTLQTVTPTANRTISFPNATGTVALVAGSSGQLVWNNAGAYAGVTSSTADASGNVTLGGLVTLSGSPSANNTSGVLVSGTWRTGASSNNPQLLINPSGTTLSTTWSTSGTGIGVNAPAAFGGNLLDLQVNGTSQVRASSAGVLTAITVDGGGATLSSGGCTLLNTRSLAFTGSLAGTISWSDLIILRDAANTLAQRNGTNAQTSRVYGTFTDASNYVRAALSSTSTAVTLAAETAGTGADDIPLNLTAAGTGTIKVNSVAEVVVSSTVAGLPAAPVVGMLTRVTDATAPVVGMTVAGGGAAAALCWYNGANWSVIGV